MTEQQPREQQFEIEIGQDIEPGVHADFASLWHTPDTFVLDFASLRRMPHVQVDDDTGRQVMKLPTRIVARVKIPPAQVFELMKALESQLTKWELETGQRRSDQPPEEPTVDK